MVDRVAHVVGALVGPALERREPLLLPLQRGRGGEPVDAGCLQGDERPVEVVDLTPGHILELRLERRPGHPCHDGPRLTLLRDVERQRDVEVVLRGAAGPPVVKRSIRDELGVHVDQRVGPQAGGENVGVCLRELVPQRADVEVGGQHPVERRVERQPVGRAWIVDDRPVDRRGGVGRRGGCRRCRKRFGQHEPAGGEGRRGEAARLLPPRQAAGAPLAPEHAGRRGRRAEIHGRSERAWQRRWFGRAADRAEIGKLEDRGLPRRR